MKERGGGGGGQYLEKTPDDQIQKMPDTKVRKFKP